MKESLKQFNFVLDKNQMKLLNLINTNNVMKVICVSQKCYNTFKKLIYKFLLDFSIFSLY